MFRFSRFFISVLLSVSLASGFFVSAAVFSRVDDAEANPLIAAPVLLGGLMAFPASLVGITYLYLPGHQVGGFYEYIPAGAIGAMLEFIPEDIRLSDSLAVFASAFTVTTGTSLGLAYGDLTIPQQEEIERELDKWREWDGTVDDEIWDELVSGLDLDEGSASGGDPSLREDLREQWEDFRNNATEMQWIYFYYLCKWMGNSVSPIGPDGPNNLWEAFKGMCITFLSGGNVMISSLYDLSSTFCEFLYSISRPYYGSRGSDGSVVSRPGDAHHRYEYFGGGLYLDLSRSQSQLYPWSNPMSFQISSDVEMEQAFWDFYSGVSNGVNAGLTAQSLGLVSGFSDFSSSSSAPDSAVGLRGLSRDDYESVNGSILDSIWDWCNVNGYVIAAYALGTFYCVPASCSDWYLHVRERSSGDGVTNPYVPIFFNPLDVASAVCFSLFDAVYKIDGSLDSGSVSGLCSDSSFLFDFGYGLFLLTNSWSFKPVQTGSFNSSFSLYSSRVPFSDSSVYFPNVLFRTYNFSNLPGGASFVKFSPYIDWDAVSVTSLDDSESVSVVPSTGTMFYNHADFLPEELPFVADVPEFVSSPVVQLLNAPDDDTKTQAIEQVKTNVRESTEALTIPSVDSPSDVLDTPVDLSYPDFSQPAPAPLSPVNPPGFSDYSNLPWREIFPFCLLYDLEDLNDAVALSNGGDSFLLIRVPFMLSLFADGAGDELVIDMRQWYPLGGYIHVFFVFAYLVVLLGLYWRFFLRNL